jgi:hypothetical protein
MSKIIGTYSLDNEIWNVESDIGESHCDLEFKFINNGVEVSVLENLTVGYELYQDGVDFKIQGHQYNSSNVPDSIALTLGGNIGYNLTLCVVSNGTTESTEYTFTTPDWNEAQ